MIVSDSDIALPLPASTRTHERPDSDEQLELAGGRPVQRSNDKEYSLPLNILLILWKNKLH